LDLQKGAETAGTPTHPEFTGKKSISNPLGLIQTGFEGVSKGFHT